MGMFDFMLSPEKKLAKNTRRLTNRDSQPEDREASAQWLANEGSPIAIMGLLSRFDMKLDHQLKDKGETDIVYSILVSMGEPVVVPCKSWLRQCVSLARPLALLGDLQGEEAAIDAALEILEIETERGNEFKPAKKRAALIWLAEKRHPEAIERVSRFLEDFDEGVRYAAAEVMAMQRDDAARLPMLAALANPEEESNRLRVRICEIFTQRGWSVSEHEEVLATCTPDGFAIRNGVLVKA
ncbi:MAG: HEAT repeat domain-containing protein [Myxococcota bacterium]